MDREQVGFHNENKVTRMFDGKEQVSVVEKHW